MTMAPKASNNDLLILHVFEESLAYWCALKKRIRQHHKTEQKLLHEDGTVVSDLPVYLHRELANYFLQQQQTMERLCSGGQYTHYMQIRYALVAFIDDQLLNKDSGLLTTPARWIDYLLERSLFDTSVAGDKLIREMQTLIAEDAGVNLASKQARLLAYVYLCLLWQGFKGRLYKSSDDEKALARIKAALIEICEYSALDIHDKNNALINQAFGYNGTQSINSKEKDNARLAPISRWHRVVGIAAALYLAISTAVWFGLTYGLNGALDKELLSVHQRFANHQAAKRAAATQQDKQDKQDNPEKTP